MINYICLKISNYLIKEKIITDKERNIYSYLFSCVFEEIIFDLITLAVHHLVIWNHDNCGIISTIII